MVSCFKNKWIPSLNTELSVSVGIVEHRDRPHSPVRYFTQADINHGKIAYRPPTAAPHLREIIAFSFAGKKLNVLCSAKSDCWFSSSPGMILWLLIRACDLNNTKDEGICLVGTFQKFTQFLKWFFASCLVYQLSVNYWGMTVFTAAFSIVDAPSGCGTGQTIDLMLCG